ncbi:MAG: amidohydrolase family protein, partial [Candidatus Kariarchaeaceae archaeon]
MAHRTVITSTNFLDTETLERKVNQTIVIEGTSISWVGPHSEYSQNEGDTIIDGTGKFVIPGLFDLHVHLNYRFTDFQNMGDLFTRRKESYADLIAVKHAQSYLTKGVTTVRGVGGRKSLASLRQLIDEGLYIGPRLRLALNTIAQPGNQEYFGPEALIHDRKNNEPISGVDGILHAVRQRKADGANHIKTMTTGGVLHGKTSDVNLSLWNDEELRAMVVEAERLGMYVCAHAHNNNGIKAAVKAGVRSIEHSTMLDEDTIDLMVQMGTYI